MRNFKSTTKIKQKHLNEVFPEIMDLYSMEETDAYTKVSVCAFDHWLTQEEAIKEIDDVSHRGEKEHNKKLHEFSVALAENTECYLVKLIGKKKGKVTYREFTSEIGLRKQLVPEHHYIADSCRFVLALPKLKGVYFEGSDFTHHFYFKGTEDIQEISDLANKYGLHIIK